MSYLFVSYKEISYKKNKYAHLLHDTVNSLYEVSTPTGNKAPIKNYLLVSYKERKKELQKVT